VRRYYFQITQSHSFYDKRIHDMNWMNEKNSSEIEEFLKLLALCHTVVPEIDQKTGNCEYQAASPDEDALVKGAKYLGVNFFERSSDLVKIKINDQEETYKLLNIIEFTSSRKRMSAIYQDKDEKIFILTKGADSGIYFYSNIVILPLLKKDTKQIDETLNNLLVFAEEGLRYFNFFKIEL
jgi:magnesium-transporting ATPase (P-type)